MREKKLSEIMEVVLKSKSLNQAVEEIYKEAHSFNNLISFSLTMYRLLHENEIQIETTPGKNAFDNLFKNLIRLHTNQEKYSIIKDQTIQKLQSKPESFFQIKNISLHYFATFLKENIYACATAAALGMTQDQLFKQLNELKIDYYKIKFSMTINYNLLTKDKKIYSLRFIDVVKAIRSSEGILETYTKLKLNVICFEGEDLSKTVEPFKALKQDLDPTNFSAIQPATIPLAQQPTVFALKRAPKKAKTQQPLILSKPAVHI